jgi:glycosyltransferase involved in cell wall biosynthesis
MDVSALLSLSKLSIFFIRPTYSKLSSSPTKQAEIMAMGIPLICNSGIGDTDAIVEKYDAGYVLETLNLKSYKDIMDKINLDKFEKSKLREAAMDYASLSQGVSVYLDIYNNLS